MQLFKRFLIFLAVITLAMLLWVFFPHMTDEAEVMLNTEVFASEEWQNLGSPVLVPLPTNYGRANPFAGYESVENEAERDKIRLEIIDKTRAGLRRFFDARGIYPQGERIEVGSRNGGCISALGWVSEDVCAVPANPAANIQYARKLQPDPGFFTIIYSRNSEDDTQYTIQFVLETDELLGPAGEYIANENGILRK